MQLTFAELLRRCRGDAGLTQEALAEKAGLSPDAIGALERGARRRPRPDTVARLVGALGLDQAQGSELLSAARTGPDRRESEAVVPRMLPAEAGHFTGRVGPARFLAGQLRCRQRGPDTTRIVGLTGMGGVGKTSLAVHVAHRLESEFADGTLYIDLHAHGAVPPLSAAEALRALLLALGYRPGDVPERVDDAAGAFRSTVAGRELLVVLDNAYTEDQVLPLLPGAPSCAVLITSRRALPGVSATASVHLDTLGETESMDLFTALVGRERVEAEPGAAQDVVRFCGGLPLAIRMAAGRLTARHGWSLSDLAGRLADERRRLAELDQSGVGVRTTFVLSIRQLAESPDRIDQHAARCFRWLGVIDAMDLSAPVAGRLAMCSQADAESQLERLADVCLVEAPAPGRFRLHDLMRASAGELAEAELSASERAGAVDRVLGLYIDVAWQAYVAAQPDGNRLHWAGSWSGAAALFGSSSEAFGWLDQERQNLLALTRQAAAHPEVDRAGLIRLAVGMFAYYTTRGHFSEWRELCRRGLTVAQTLGDLSAEVRLRNDLGVCCAQQGRSEDALRSFQESLRLARRHRDRHGEAASLSNLVQLHRRLGSVADGVRYAAEALSVYQELGDASGRAIAHECLGTMLCMTGDVENGIAELTRGLTISRSLGHLRAAAICLRRLGIAHRDTGDYELSAAELQESATLSEDLGDRMGLLDATVELADLHAVLSGHERERDLLETALQLSIDGRDGPREQELRQRLAALSEPAKR